MQLTKANSIEGCKKKGVMVMYTWARNLLKTADMAVGAVTFHDQNDVRRVHTEKDNTIVNRVMKTKEERNPNMQSKLLHLSF